MHRGNLGLEDVDLMQYIIQCVLVHVHKQTMNSREQGDSDNLLDFMFSYIGIGRYFRDRDEPTSLTVATRCGQAVYEFTESLRGPIIIHIIPYFNLQALMIQRWCRGIADVHAPTWPFKKELKTGDRHQSSGVIIIGIDMPSSVIS
jgi:hypothetical protein